MPLSASSGEPAHGIVVTGGFRSALAANDAVARLMARPPAALKVLRLLGGPRQNPSGAKVQFQNSTFPGEVLLGVLNPGSSGSSGSELCTLVVGLMGSLADVTLGQRAAWQAIELAQAVPQARMLFAPQSEDKAAGVDEGMAAMTGASPPEPAAVNETMASEPVHDLREIVYGAGANDLAGFFDAALGLGTLLAVVAVDADLLAGTLTVRWQASPRDVEALAWLAGQARDFDARIVVWPSF